MNGPDSPTDVELDQDPGLEDRLADYSIGTTVVYGAFAWSQEPEALSLWYATVEKSFDRPDIEGTTPLRRPRCVTRSSR